VGVTPLLGSGIDRDKVPAATTVLTQPDLARGGPTDALRGLDDAAGGVTLSDAQGNPFQPSLLYRGFQASPLVGNAQGLAVYVNGGRFNQPFGDTVNWDLIPDVAIKSMNLVGSNPAFGLNALGGALAVELKDGFNHHGTTLELSGGSFGRIQGTFESGRQIGQVGLYVAGSGLAESGWRDFSPSDKRQLYGDLGWRGDAGELHLNLSVADNHLAGNGTTPVDLLAVDRAAVFTHPDDTRNKYLRLALSGTHEIDDATALQGNLYYQNFDQRTVNGDTASVQPCTGNATLLCTTAGAPLTSPGGATITNFVTGSPYAASFAQFAAGGPYAVLNQTATITNGYGGTVQATRQDEPFGMPNHLVGGASLDGGVTSFAASTLIGPLGLDRGFPGPGVIVDQADGSIAPVRVGITNAYYGVFAVDTLDVTDALSATVSGRLNVADIDLKDQLGTALTGDHVYSRFNPGAGLTYKLTPALSAYAGYAEANRAPTPAELSCASPLAPCSLNNFFVGDPGLKQVVARTVEAGLRGAAAPVEGAELNWRAGLFRTDSDDDIQFVASPTIGRDFFENVGTTRRQGVETSAELRVGRWHGFASYSYTDATYRTALTIDGGSNPQADANGLLHVQPGDRLPGVPAHVAKLGVDCDVTPAWTLGATLRAASGQYLIGDASNLNAPTAAYAVLNLDTEYRLTDHVTVFGLIQNATDTHYATFGTFSPTSLVPILQAPNASNPRSLSPGAPIGVWAGLRVAF
ncbi:MAG TPA: TonB-dependent receptor, partial [Candidatus Sulfotelmatobacter sp.]|nr:TonB-dependent receptor [Candidatus Sulfotelmatobacter sp.]